MIDFARTPAAPRSVVEETDAGSRDPMSSEHRGTDSDRPDAPRPRPRPRDPEAEADLERLGDRIARLAAHIDAATYRLLELIADFDRRFQEAGGGTGFRSTAHWLGWRTGLGLNAARERVRVARALERLPKIGAEMRRGALSYSKVRALTRVATPANEAELMEFALHGTAAQVERLVRAWRKVDRQVAAEGEAPAGAGPAAGGQAEARERAEALEAERRRASRHLSLWPDDDGSWVLRARLEPVAGMCVKRALEAAREALFREERREGGAGRPSSGDPRASTASGGASTGGPGRALPEEVGRPTAEQRRADALGLLAEWALTGGALEAAGAASASSDAASPEADAASSGSGAVSAGSDATPPGSDAASADPAPRPAPTGPAPGGGVPRLPPSGLRAERFQVVVHVDAEALQAAAARDEEVAAPGRRGPAASSGRGPTAPGSRGPAAPGSRGPAPPDPASERPGDVSAEMTRPGPAADVSAETPRLAAGAARAPRASRAAPGLSAVPVRPGAFLENGIRLSRATARRLACDARRVVMVHGADDGGVLGVGRKTRAIPTRLRRALEHRDGGCVFPGCGNRIADGHHLRHWIDGGPTDLDNLVLLCRRHHLLVHEAGFGIEWAEGLEGEEIRFLRPDGRPLPEAPPPPALFGGEEEGDPTRSLIEEHRRAGIDPDPWTPTPPGIGEKLDLGLAIDLMWRAADGSG